MRFVIERALRLANEGFGEEGGEEMRTIGSSTVEPVCDRGTRPFVG